MRKPVRSICYTFAALALFSAVQSKTANATVISSWAWGTASDTIDGIVQAGTATFSTGGAGELILTLTNTGATAPTGNKYILDGLFFDLSTGGALTMESAYATGGLLSAINQTAPDNLTGGTATNICNTATTAVVGASGCGSSRVGGWEAAYDSSGFSSLNSLITGGHWGIGTSGISIFSGNPTKGVSNSNYGIAPGNSVGIGSGSNIASDFPYVYGTATFTFSGFTDGATVSNVFASYGTQPEGFFAAEIQPPTDNPPGNNPPGNNPPNDPTGVPEPASVMSCAGGGILLLLVRLRRKAR